MVANERGGREREREKEKERKRELERKREGERERGGSREREEEGREREDNFFIERISQLLYKLTSNVRGL